MDSWSFPTLYSLFVRIQVHQDRFVQFTSAASKITAAFHEHATGGAWAAYSTVAGPGLYVYTLMPLRDLRQLDEMPPLETIMTDVYGPSGLDELRLFRESVVAMEGSVLTGVGTDLPAIVTGPRPPQYFYYASIEVRETLTAAFFTATRRLTSARKEPSIFAYRTFAGRSRVHFFAAGDSIADLGHITNGNGSVPELETQFQDSIASMESSILRYMGHGNG